MSILHPGSDWWKQLNNQTCMNEFYSNTANGNEVDNDGYELLLPRRYGIGIDGFLGRNRFLWL
jgi:hypothetical protein